MKYKESISRLNWEFADDVSEIPLPAFKKVMKLRVWVLLVHYHWCFVENNSTSDLLLIYT